MMHISRNRAQSNNPAGTTRTFPGIRWEARRGTVLAVVVIGGIVLAACSSSPSTPSTSTTSSSMAATPTATLSSLEAKVPTTPVSLTESGSSLLAPLFGTWATAYSADWKNVTIPTAAGGSGKGISDAIAGTSQIGGSDAYLSSTEVSQNPGLMNVPLAISAQLVAYNIPGVTGNLKLSGPVLSAIYQGTITTWNDPKIEALNPGVTLPSIPIVTIHRSDSSGDTFLFTSFLSDTDPSGWGAKISFGTTVAFPAITGALGESGNSAMVSTCQATKGCVAYIGISYLAKVQAAGLGEAKLENKSKNFVLPTSANIAAEADGFTANTPADGTISMIFGSAAEGYPIVNYEYAVVKQTQSSAAIAETLQSFLAWTIDPRYGNSATYLGPVGFVALPPAVDTISANLLAKITG